MKVCYLSKTLKTSLLFYFFLLLTLLGCEEILLEKDISNKAVELIAPTNNAQLFSTGVTFTWNTVTDATEYQLQIARPNFNNPIQIVLDTTITQNSFTQQLSIGQYEWRVRALNSGYSTTFSNYSITIISNDDFENNSVQLISPNANLITNNTFQNLNWQEIIGATNYEIQIIDNNNTIIVDQNTQLTSYNHTFNNGTFQWRVRATNGSDFTLFYGRNILVDTVIPNTPIPTTPSNNGNTTAGNIDFQWTRTPVQGSIEKDSIYIYTNSALTNLVEKAESSSPYSTNLNSGTFYWRVKSFDQAGNTSNMSNTFSINVN